MDKLKCVLLIDDDIDDNFFHERAIRKYNGEIKVVNKKSGTEALDYLNSVIANNEEHPDLIFLDINMPQMNGWQFLDEYNSLRSNLSCKAIIVMLSTSTNPEDIQQSKEWHFVADYITKPLTPKILNGLVGKHFAIEVQ